MLASELYSSPEQMYPYFISLATIKGGYVLRDLSSAVRWLRKWWRITDSVRIWADQAVSCSWLFTACKVTAWCRSRFCFPALQTLYPLAKESYLHHCTNASEEAAQQAHIIALLSALMYVRTSCLLQSFSVLLAKQKFMYTTSKNKHETKQQKAVQVHNGSSVLRRRTHSLTPGVLSD